MRTVLVTALAACTVAMATPAGAQTTEDRAAARDLVAKRGDAVILILATLKTRTTVGGRENSQDRPMQANATVLDKTGLAVMALSAIEPSEAMVRRIGGAGAQVQTETAELRMRLHDGTEVPARIVLRDADLDLVFLRPVDPLTSAIPAVDAAQGKPAPMDLVIVLSRTGEQTNFRPIASFGYIQMTVDKPRTYHAVVGGNTPGAAVFDSAGRFVGVFLAVGGSRSLPFVAVLPADDIREIAKQATGK